MFGVDRVESARVEALIFSTNLFIKTKSFYFCLTKSSKSHGTGQNWLKIIVSSLNLIPTPAPDKIFNAHPLDFFNANFDVPEVYCFAAEQRAI